MEAEAHQFLKVGDVAAKLNLSEQTVRLWCRSHVLPAYRPPSTRQWLIDAHELEVWLKNSANVDVVDWLHAPWRTNLSDEEIVAGLHADRAVRDEAGQPPE